MELAINSVTSTVKVNIANLIVTDTYENLNDDAVVENLLEKYKEQIAPAYEVIGQNAVYRRGNYMRQLVADLYYQAGIEKWGDQYEIALGGGFISVRSPYNLEAGDVKYQNLQSLFPFDNELVLCSIDGRDLLSYFIESNNDNYFTKYKSGLKESINPNGTYYIVIDTYTSTYKYAPKSLKEVARYDGGVYARDLLADYIRNGGLE